MTARASDGAVIPIISPWRSSGFSKFGAGQEFLCSSVGVVIPWTAGEEISEMGIVKLR
jgi:hypothetical protein